MKVLRCLIILPLLAIAGSLGGCHTEKTTRKVTVEGPSKKTEVKIETTKEKDHD